MRRRRSLIVLTILAVLGVSLLFAQVQRQFIKHLRVEDLQIGATTSNPTAVLPAGGEVWAYNDADTTAGIQDALALVPLGGIVRLQAGTYTISTGITMNDKQALVGMGPAATIIAVSTNTTGITVTGSGAVGSRLGRIEDLTIQPTTANSNAMITLDTTNGMVLSRLHINANDLTNTGKGIFLDSSVATSIQDIRVADNDTGAVGTWATGIMVSEADTTILNNVRFVESTIGLDLVSSGATQTGGVTVINCDWNTVTTAIQVDTTDFYNNLTVVGTAMFNVTNRLVETGGHESQATNTIYSGYPDAQSTFFDSLFLALPAYQTITAVSDTINYQHRNVLYLTGDASYTLTSTPTIADGLENNQELMIQNSDTVDSFTFQDAGTLASSNLDLRTATAKLAPGQSLTLRFDTGTSLWLETDRSGAVGSNSDNSGILLWGDQDVAATDTGSEVCAIQGLTCVGAVEATGTEITNCTTVATGSTTGWFYALCK